MSRLYSVYLLRTLSAFRLPAGTPRRLRTAWRISLPLAALLWGPVIASIWWGWDPRLIAVMRPAAATAAIIAAACWITATLSTDGRRELTRLSADLYQRIPEAERPPRLVASGR